MIEDKDKERVISELDIKCRQFDGHDFYYVEGMPQIDCNEMSETEPSFGNCWEQKICREIVSQIHGDMNFADMGAHFGQFAMVAAKRTTGTVYCFEPEYRNLVLLRLNAEVMGNMVVYPVCLYKECANVGFFHKGTGAGSHKIELDRESKVKAVTLDSLNIKFDMANVDIEGAGGHMLDGGVETFKTVKCATVEFHSGESGAKDKLIAMGFRMDWNIENGQFWVKDAQEN